MALAFLYAGQGSQKEGMGRDFYEKYEEVREIFDSKAVSFDIADTCFNADMEKLTDTLYTQPCMAAFGAAVTKLLLAKGLKPAYTAGLSLGEYGALHAAGVFDSDTMLELLAYRGKVMSDTTNNLDTKMAAIIGLTDEQVCEAVAQALQANLGIVAPANFNAVGQVVIGGASKAVDKACEICNDMGARRALPLKVSAPFHTAYMEEASRLMGEKLRSVSMNAPTIPVIHNATGDIMKESETVSHLLEVQVKMPVLFKQTIEKLATLGVDQVIEIGPGNVIAWFIKKTAPGIKVYSIEDTAGLDAALKALTLEV